jgi:hypothetical protein
MQCPKCKTGDLLTTPKEEDPGYFCVDCAFGFSANGEELFFLFYKHECPVCRHPLQMGAECLHCEVVWLDHPTMAA